MDYAKTSLAERLAAEYVLGTLRGPARRRFEALLAAHPRLRQGVADWQRRLGSLDDAVPAQDPPAHVWRAIEQRLFGAAAPGIPRTPWWRHVAVWQGVSAAALTVAVALTLVLSQPRPQQPPVVVVMAPDGGAANFVASLSADGGSLVLKPVGGVALEPRHSLELWAVPAQGAPRSLGVVHADRATTLRRAVSLQETAALAVTVEPVGGSPTGLPTGPRVSLGKMGT